MHLGFHHLYHNKSKHRHTAWVSMFEKIIYVGAFVGPVMTIPQVAKIWVDKSANGVSVITWVGYLGGAVLWIIYGLLHKEKLIVATNISSGLLALIIVVGVLIYS